MEPTRVREQLKRLTGYSYWDVPRVQFFPLADEATGTAPEEQTGDLAETLVAEASDTKEMQDKRTLVIGEEFKAVTFRL